MSKNQPNIALNPDARNAGFGLRWPAHSRRLALRWAVATQAIQEAIFIRSQSTPIKTATNYWLSFCVVLLTYVLTGCAPTGNVDQKYDPSAAGAQQFLPIPVPAPAYELNGFSVMPPTGERWMVKEGVTRTKVEFIRSTDVGPNHTVIAWAEIVYWQGSESSVKEIVRQITEPIGKEFMDQSRYANPQIDIVEMRLAGLRCSEFSFSVQDRGVPYAPGKIFIIRGWETYCLHSGSPKPILIKLAHSQRYLQGQRTLPIESELKSFRDGITVMPLPTSGSVVSSFPSAKQFYESCVSVETKKALAGIDSRKPMNHRDASYYAHLLCSVMADSCLKEPESPACQSSLKSYKLLD